MELKEGMYVRTKDGHIGKITFISPLDKTYCIDTMIFPIGKHFIEKASYNIIDLIEVGDYVDGEYITNVIRCKNGKVKYIEFGEFSHEIKNKDIKSIVTKEQFESMSYKVGE